MTIYYVATNGSNSANGSSASPWKTISYAMQRDLKAGDTVIVRAGTYNEAVVIDHGGSAAGDVTLKSETPGAALIRPPSGGWNAISVAANHVTVDGFDIGGARGDGIEANNVHHITIRNSTVHGSGESGIQFNWSEFITIEGNETYENGSTGWFSGISIYQTRNITGDTTTQGFRTIVRNNISHDNVTKTGQHTDGNGIIIDDFQSTQTSGYKNYTYPTLVDGNVVYNNGGKGIQVTWSDGVTVSNNTAYHNNQDSLNTGTWRGELSNSQSSNNTWVNNIAVSDPSINKNNTAIDNTSTGGYTNKNVIWSNNVTFNGASGQASLRLDGGNAAPSAANGNKLGVDPLFVNPANGDFHVKAGSPAIDAGTGAYGLGSTDVSGAPRVVGTVDVGAYEQGSGGSVNHAPVAKADSGFVTTANTAVTISAATLLANDTDQDGNPLTLTGVSSPSHGTVKIDGSNVIFTPTTGYTGSAGFSYSISDGKGGTASAAVSLSVDAASSNVAPKFTSGTAFGPNENTKAVGTVTASDTEGDALTFAKNGGADAALFNIDSKTGAITFINAPDYEKPGDADGNNVYMLGVSVTDGKHNPVTTNLQISVKNVAEHDPADLGLGIGLLLLERPARGHGDRGHGRLRARDEVPRAQGWRHHRAEVLPRERRRQRHRHADPPPLEQQRQGARRSHRDLRVRRDRLADGGSLDARPPDGELAIRRLLRDDTELRRLGELLQRRPDQCRRDPFGIRRRRGLQRQGRLRQRPGFFPDADLECLQLLGGRGLQGLGVGFKLLRRRRGCP